MGIHEARKHDFAPRSTSGGETWLGMVLLRQYTSVIRPVVLSTVIEVSVTKSFFLGSKRREVCIVNADIGAGPCWLGASGERNQADIACWRNNNQSPYYKRVSCRKGNVCDGAMKVTLVMKVLNINSYLKSTDKVSA